MKHLFRIFVALLWLNGQASATYLGSGPFTMQGLGTAGTPTGGVLSIQGVSGGTVIPFALNATPSLANGNGIVQTQGGSVLSATNGVYANILQGNAVLATGNPLFITGTGTAGTAATNPITVQGIASMTPLLVNPGTSASWGVGATGSAVPANGFYNTINIGGTLRGWTGINPTGTTYAGQIDVTSVAGTLTATGNGTSGAGDLRINIASDNSNAAGIGGSATGSAVPTAARYVGGNASGNLTGFTVCDHRALINLTASGQIITGSSSKKTYICSINLISATAQNIALVEGTGSVCATGIAGMAGGTTAATGWNFVANEGLTQGTGIGVVAAADNTAADNVCLLISSSGQTSGVATYTQF